MLLELALGHAESRGSLLQRKHSTCFFNSSAALSSLEVGKKCWGEICMHVC